VNLTEQNVVSTKNITGTGITVTGGEGSSLKDVGLSITPGLDQTVLVTTGAGAVEWVPQADLNPTTNELALNANELTSTVDGIASSVNLTDQNVVSTKNITGTGITVTGGEGSSLKDVGLSITPGLDQTMLVTNGAGTVEWVPQPVIEPITNELTVTGNTITSNVSNVVDTAELIGTVENSVTGTSLVTLVNTVASTAVDLKGAIQQGQLNTVVDQGSGIEVTNTVVDDTTTYLVALDPTTANVAGDVTGTLSNTKVVGLQTKAVSAVSPTDKQVLTYNEVANQWEAKTPEVDVTKVLNGKALKSTDLSLSADASTALLKEVTIDINTGAVNSDKILDRTILAEDIANAGPKEVLVTGDTGEAQWSTQASVVQENQKTTVVQGSGDAIVTPVVVDKVTTYTVDVQSAMPKFFYMPSILMPTAEGQTSQGGVSFDNATRMGTVDLHAIYQAQFTTPVVASNPSAALPTLEADKLNFFVTYVDASVFTNLTLSEEGILTYEVTPTANVTTGSFMNIVFTVR
ncbi:hypothetical protein ACFQZL_02825, partial [Myroides pelagicus]